MKIKVLASGSKGNSTIITTNKYNILIDAGITLKQLNTRVESLDKIDIIIITHSHSDHIKGLKPIYNKYKSKIITKSRELIEDYDIDLFEEKIILDNLEIDLFDLSHDVDCCGISIKEDEKELVYITDTGYINQKILKKIINKDIYIMESNYDVKMLMDGNYPYHLQQRIRSDSGHLSNDDACSYIKKIIGDKTSYIILAHLSEDNNTLELAYNKMKDVIDIIPNNIKEVLVAKQEESLEVIEI